MLSLVERILLKVGRANGHIKDLKSTIGAFLDNRPYSVKGNRNEHTGHLEWMLTSAREIPINICLIAGDAIQNLRSALDHLAWQLVLANGGSPTTSTCFPISKSAAVHLSKETQQRMAGMCAEAIAAINALHPYAGGNVTLWRLHSLNNRDKHKLLLAAAHALIYHDALPSQRLEITRLFQESYPSAAPPDLTGMTIRPEKALFPLEVGKVFFSIPEAEMENNFKFQLGIAFNEPGLIEGEMVLRTLENFSRVVQDIITNFSPFLI